MFQQILDALEKKYPGVDKKILERMAKKLAKTTKNEDDVQTAVDGVSVQQLIDSESDRRSNEATDTAIRNYETKHNLKDGKPVKTDDDDDDEIDDDDDDPSAEDGKQGKQGDKKKAKLTRTEKMLQQVLKQQQTLTEELTQMKQEKVGNSRKARFEALLKDADEKVRNRYMRDYDRLTFKDDADYDAWLEDITPTIESDINDAKAAGGVSTPPKGGKQTGRKDGEVDPAVTAYLDTTAANESGNTFSGIAGLPQAPAPQAAPVAK